MDFSKHDARSAAETPTPMLVLDQRTGKPILDGKKKCAVLVRGASSRSAQARLRAEEAARQKAASAKRGAHKRGKNEEDDLTKDLQASMIRSAKTFIAGFENIQRPDPETKELRDLTVSDDDIMWFLDLNMVSVPHLLRIGNDPEQEEDEDDDEYEARLAEHKAKWLSPSFAQQVIDHAREDDNFLGKSSAD
ncbi:hypothetical protein GCM10007928_02160 [Sulfitobacter porphyrae]|nr:hypothetical protein GCM10007928_02160 [Sulfitobacter porphyrae]